METASLSSKRSKASQMTRKSSSAASQKSKLEVNEEEEETPVEKVKKTKMITQVHTRKDIEHYIETTLFVAERRVPEDKVSCDYDRAIH